jgi:hypothetical protein
MIRPATQGDPFMKIASKARSLGLAAAACAALLSGCASYYTVRDLATGKEYYTQDLARYGTGVLFTDARTGSEISLQSSEVIQIPEDLYLRYVTAPMLVMPTVIPPEPASAGR